ncbi:MAG: serine hydrolase domain-containing protein, partial [Bacteroidota bacterium]
MRNILFVFVLASSFISCQQKKQATKTVDTVFDTAYQPAVFTGKDRLQKISETFPLIDKMFKDYADSNHLPGVAYGLVVDGKLVYKGNIGYTDVRKKIPVTSSSLFRIASMSKSFTCMAILKLRDEGKLNLDDPAYLYIPELKKLKYPTADAPHITVRHLMTHGAGFPEDNPWGDRQLADTDNDLIDLINKQLSFSNPPGIAFEYSNLGFALQGMIITKVSGMPYQEYIKKNILEPLGMKTTTYEYADVAPDKLAHGYRWLNDTWSEEALLHDTKDGS